MHDAHLILLALYVDSGGKSAVKFGYKSLKHEINMQWMHRELAAIFKRMVRKYKNLEKD